MHLQSSLELLAESGEYFFNKEGIYLVKHEGKFVANDESAQKLLTMVSREWYEQYIITFKS